MSQEKTLLCSVGTGNLDDLTDTLLRPLAKSIRQGLWNRVILLPSKLTVRNAQILQKEINDVSIRIDPLPQSGMEENVDSCYAHFNEVISKLLRSDCQSENLVVDFTRGTKAMSAALVLAAIGNSIPLLRYVSGSRDSRGTVVPGNESVSEVKTTIATAQRRLDDAVMLLRHGNFSAVVDLLGASPLDDWPESLGSYANLLRQLASFYAAWDRLDYQEAARRSNVLRDLHPDQASDGDATKYAPSEEVLAWIDSLAAERPAGFKDRAKPLRFLLIDLFANGERRLRHHQYEDALLRAYRVLELLGQVRLFERGLDSANLPPDDERIIAFEAQLKKKKSEPLSRGAKGVLQAPREKVARLLKHLGDRFGQQLLDACDNGKVKARSRNQSVLIHGFDYVAGSDARPLTELFKTLEDLIQLDFANESECNRLLRLARFPCLLPSSPR